ncbi:hypothetical protein FRC08_003632 [Ceratobasidium sp. 394]|nr:hypothetical protein FRC08_003632 [Ceratobasidium sp. 394]
MSRSREDHRVVRVSGPENGPAAQAIPTRKPSKPAKSRKSDSSTLVKYLRIIHTCPEARANIAAQAKYNSVQLRLMLSSSQNALDKTSSRMSDAADQDDDTTTTSNPSPPESTGSAADAEEQPHRAHIVGSARRRIISPPASAVNKGPESSNVVNRPTSPQESPRSTVESAEQPSPHRPILSLPAPAVNQSHESDTVTNQQTSLRPRRNTVRNERAALAIQTSRKGPPPKSAKAAVPKGSGSNSSAPKKGSKGGKSKRG